MSDKRLTMRTIPISDLQHRRTYVLKSRNLHIGVWDASREHFIGIREKFSSRFLDTETHWDAGAGNFGTVEKMMALMIMLPEEIELRTTNSPSCQVCGNLVETLRVPDATFRSGYRCTGNKHIDAEHQAACTPDHPFFAEIPQYQPLFDFLDKL